MSDNINLRDKDAETVVTRATDNAGVKSIHHIIETLEAGVPTPVSAAKRLPVSLPPTLIDAFSRVRTADPGNRFDVEFIYDKQPTLIDEVTVGSGSSATHNATSRDVTLAIGNATNGTSHALYSHYDIPYTPGCSQLIDVTGTLDNAAIGGGTAFLFVRSSVSGSVVETTYQQDTEWDDPVADIDWSKSQIFAVDFQSLKVGLIRFMFNRNGIPTPVLTVRNDNIRITGYWQSPSLPTYWRIYNDATYTYTEMGYGDTDNGIGIRYRFASTAASATLRAICATVKSEGGVKLFDMDGENRSTERATPLAVAATLVPILSIRVASLFNSITNRGLYIPVGFDVATDNPILVKVLYRPTLTGASFTPVGAEFSGMEFDTAATAVAGGIPVWSGLVASAKNTPFSEPGLLGRTLMSLGRTGVSDIVTIAGVRTTTSSAAVAAAIQWKEIR